MLPNIAQTVERAAIIIVCLIVFLTLLVLSYGLEDFNVVQIFNSDEQNTIFLIKNHLQEGTLDPHGFFTYGHLYHSISYFIVKFLSWYDWNIDTRLIGMTCRTLSVSFAILSAFALYKLATIVGLPRELAAVAALLLFTTPSFLNMSTQGLSDTLQCFLMIVAFGIVLRQPDTAHAWLGAAVAGLGFGTKYASGFLLPFCVMPRALVILAGPERVSAKIISILKLVMGAVLIFAAVFAATNPYTVIDYREFYLVLMGQAEWMSIGHGKVEPRNPLLWFPVLNSEFGLLGVSLLFVGTLLTTARTIRELCAGGWRACAINKSWRNIFTLLCYIILTITYLAVAVRIRHPRYILHILPFWSVVSLWGFWDLFRRWHLTRLSAPYLTSISAIALIVFSIAQAEYSIGQLAAITMRPLSPVFEAATFISDNYPGDTRILLETYSYVTPKFVNTRVVFFLDESEVLKFKPQLIVLNKYMSGRWVWPAPGTKFMEGTFVLDQSYGEKPARVKAFWQSLAASGWAVVYENPQVVILDKGSVHKNP